MRSETQGSSSSSSSSGSSSDSSSSSSSGAGDAIGAAIGDAMVEAYLDNVYRTYTRYPYADGTRGYNYLTDPEDPDPPGQKLGGSLTLDGGYYGPTLGRAGVDLALLVRRFGFGLDLSPHLELRPIDALTLGSASFLVAPVMRPRITVVAGVGVGFMIDGRTLPPGERTDAAGVNGTARVAVFPIRPLVLRGRFDYGRLGAATTMLGRATAGVLAGRVEPFGGAEFRRVGTVMVVGPTVGLRVWF